MEKYKVKRIKNGDFTGQDGSKVLGFWVNLLEISTGFSKEVWIRGDVVIFKEGDEIEAEIEKREGNPVKYKYIYQD